MKFTIGITTTATVVEDTDGNEKHLRIVAEYPGGTLISEQSLKVQRHEIHRRVALEAAQQKYNDADVTISGAYAGDRDAGEVFVWVAEITVPL